MIIGSCGFKFWCIETCDLPLLPVKQTRTGHQLLLSVLKNAHAVAGEFLSLELMTLKINSQSAETIKGVRVNCGAVAQIKVKALAQEDTATSGPQGDSSNVRINAAYDHKSITVAATHFLGESEETIRSAILRTMEGHQRQILGTLTVEEIYKDRSAFSQRIRELVAAEDPSAPLSDDRLAELLKEKDGIKIARRTITKYRKALAIPASSQRRQL